MAASSQRVEPTFGPAPPPGTSAAEADKPDAGRRRVRLAADAGPAAWAALACLSLAVALPDLVQRLAAAPAGHGRTLPDVEVTGSLASPAVGSVGNGFTQVLARGPSADRLWLRWDGLASRNPVLLRDIPVQVRKAPDDGEAFVLLVGQHGSASAAWQACEALRARFVPCEVGSQDGTILGEPR